MSSILKVDTIQDQESGNMIISKDSGGGGFENGDLFLVLHQIQLYLQ